MRSIVAAAGTALILLLTACGNTPISGPAPLETADEKSPPASISSSPEPSGSSPPATPTTPAPTATSTSTSTSTVTPAPVDLIYATPDGSLSFSYPPNWRVTTKSSGDGDDYVIQDESGATRATLRDKVPGVADRTVSGGIDTGFRASVPGVKGPDGENVELVVQGSSGQEPGAQTALYAITTPSSSQPLGNASVEVRQGGYYLQFGGSVPLKQLRPGDQQGLLKAAKEFSASPEFQQTAKVITSLKLTADKVVQVRCFGFRYRYDKISGLSCSEAILILDRVEKTGTANGAGNRETPEYLCSYAGATAKQDGLPDVSCHKKSNKTVGFDARKK